MLLLLFLMKVEDKEGMKGRKKKKKERKKEGWKNVLQSINQATKKVEFKKKNERKGKVLNLCCAKENEKREKEKREKRTWCEG